MEGGHRWIIDVYVAGGVIPEGRQFCGECEVNIFDYSK